jgi:hypothetical protein
MWALLEKDIQPTPDLLVAVSESEQIRPVDEGPLIVTPLLHVLTPVHWPYRVWSSSHETGNLHAMSMARQICENSPVSNGILFPG